MKGLERLWSGVRYWTGTISRYPDALAPPAVPYKSFTETDALQAYGYAKDILKLVEVPETGGTAQ
jgi:HEPN domain-containing protein